MKQPDIVYPKSRRSGLLIDHVHDETLVYDEERQEAHSLNRPASIVWSNADGTRSVDALSTLLANELGVEPDERLVEHALDELSRAHLLEDGDWSEPNGVNRREVVRRLTLAGATAIAMPVVLSVLVPTPAMAASGGGSNQNGQGQNNNSQG